MVFKNFPNEENLYKSMDPKHISILEFRKPPGGLSNRIEGLFFSLLSHSLGRIF